MSFLYLLERSNTDIPFSFFFLILRSVRWQYSASCAVCITNGGLLLMSEYEKQEKNLLCGVFVFDMFVVCYMLYT